MGEDAAEQTNNVAVAEAIAALCALADEIRAAELARAERRLRGLTDTEREIVEVVTSELVDALFRKPVARLQAAPDAERRRYVAALQDLFALEAEH